VALLGVYETRAIAEDAARNRPASLRGIEPYIRSMASLQSAMTRANAL
jgi:septal ring-binding cell division protein DamX